MTLIEAYNLLNKIGKSQYSKRDVQIIRKYIGKETGLLRDFIGGLDPTGTLTFEAGKRNIKRHALHQAAGVTGGFLGGALLVPGLVNALVTGARGVAKGKGFSGRLVGGLQGLATGFKSPYKQIYHGLKAKNILSKLKKGQEVTLKPREVEMLKSQLAQVPSGEWAKLLKGRKLPKVGEKIDLGEARNILSRLGTITELPGGGYKIKATDTKMLQQISKPLMRHLNTLLYVGVPTAGGVNALSAALQYELGRGTQTEMLKMYKHKK